MSWTARDWRQFVALSLLALSAIPLTAVMSIALYYVHMDARNTHAFWLGQSAAALILVDLVGLSAILGRRTFKFKVGNAEINATGEDAEKILEGAQ